jgi:hypothetical protein
MNLLEIFDRPDHARQYYRAKRPIAVLLSLFGIICMAISTPAGAYFLESLLMQFLPFGATVAAWGIAIGFDALLAIIAANFFADIFRGLDNRQSYWDIPTILLLVVFLTASILASVFGADVRKARAAQEVAKIETAAIDSTLLAVTTLATGDKLKVAPKGADKQTLRQIRKYNEQVNAAKKTNAGKMQTISKLSDQKQAKSAQAQEEHHALIDSSKTVIVAAYLFLMIFIACVEYIKSKKPKQEQKPKSKSKSDGKSADSEGNSDKSEDKSKSNGIGFFGNSEGHILNSTIAYKKANGELKYYKAYELSALISDAKKKGKLERAERFERLKTRLKTQR